MKEATQKVPNTHEGIRIRTVVSIGKLKLECNGLFQESRTFKLLDTGKGCYNFSNDYIDHMLKNKIMVIPSLHQTISHILKGKMPEMNQSIITLIPEKKLDSLAFIGFRFESQENRLVRTEAHPGHPLHATYIYPPAETDLLWKVVWTSPPGEEFKSRRFNSLENLIEFFVD